MENNLFLNNNVLEKYAGLSKEVIIPNGIISIGDFAFYQNRKIEKVILPKGLQSIGKSAFYGCKNLKEITLPDTLENISTGAFTGCHNLDNLIIPNKINTIHQGVFYNCRSLKNLTGIEHVEFIERSAFKGCDSLGPTLSLTNIVSIGVGAFTFCPSLKTVYFGKRLETIENESFASQDYTINFIQQETRLQSIKLDKNNPFFRIDSGNLIKNDSDYPVLTCSSYKYKKEIIIDEGTKILSNDLLNNIKNVNKITIPNSIEKFKGDIRIINTLPDELFNVKDGVFYLGNDSNKFLVLVKAHGTSEQLSIPSGCKVICPYAFSNCYNLRRIDFPDSLNVIEEHAFEKCISLEEMVIPEKVSEIGYFAFFGCVSLSSLHLKSNKTKLNNDCLKACISLCDIDFSPEIKYGFDIKRNKNKTKVGCLNSNYETYIEDDFELFNRCFNKINYLENADEVRNYDGTIQHYDSNTCLLIFPELNDIKSFSDLVSKIKNSEKCVFLHYDNPWGIIEKVNLLQNKCSIFKNNIINTKDKWLINTSTQKKKYEGGCLIQKFFYQDAEAKIELLEVSKVPNSQLLANPLYCLGFPFYEDNELIQYFRVDKTIFRIHFQLMT